jgi:hypothetical protein
MKGFLATVSVISWIISAVLTFTGIGIYKDASTIMQQGVAMDYIISGALFFIAAMVGLSQRSDIEKVTVPIRLLSDLIRSELRDIKKILDK